MQLHNINKLWICRKDTTNWDVKCITIWVPLTTTKKNLGSLFQYVNTVVENMRIPVVGYTLVLAAFHKRTLDSTIVNHDCNLSRVNARLSAFYTHNRVLYCSISSLFAYLSFPIFNILYLGIATFIILDFFLLVLHEICLTEMEGSNIK